MSVGGERERILSIRTIRPFLMSPKPNTSPGRAGASSSGAAIFSAPVISLTSPRCSFTLSTLCRNLSYRNRAPFRSNKCGRFEAGDLLTSDLREIGSGVDPHLCVHTHVDRQRAVVTPGHTRAKLKELKDVAVRNGNQPRT